MEEQVNEIDTSHLDIEMVAADEAAAVAAYWHVLRTRNVDAGLAKQLTRQYAFNLGHICDEDDDGSEEPFE